MLGIVDYGAGNLGSIGKAFDYFNVEYRFITSASELRSCSGIVLPGVGSFGAAVEMLKERNFFSEMKSAASEGIPILGICLGMQLLMRGSDESPAVEGLNFFEGRCRKFIDGKVPHIGWNSVYGVRPDSQLFYGLEDSSLFYFVHSYYAEKRGSREEQGLSCYGEEFVPAIEYENICGVQFHPEKSGKCGLRLLENWIRFYFKGEENG